MRAMPWAAIDSAIERTRPVTLSGRVTQVGGLLVEGVLPVARMGMVCLLRIRDQEPVPAEVVELHGDTVTLMPMLPVSGITVGTPIEPRELASTVALSTEMVGRVIDGWGRPIDGGPPLRCVERYPLRPGPDNPMARGAVEEPLSVGVTAVDALLTSGSGQRVVIMAGAGVGKSTLLGMMARHTEADLTVVALVGERSREVKKFVESELGAHGLERAIVVAETSSSAVALRIRAALVAFAVSEYFRDQGLRVLLLVDSFSRVCTAQRELGLAIGEPPTTRGYPPSAFTIIPQLLERAGPGPRGGSITCFCTALLESDDLGDPIGDAIRAVTDGHIVLSRQLAERGHFPAIDVLASTSRVMSEVAGEEHRRAARIVRATLADLKEVEELVTFGAYDRGNVPRFDRALDAADDLNAFLRQVPEERRGLQQSRRQLLELAAALSKEAS